MSKVHTECVQNHWQGVHEACNENRMVLNNMQDQYTKCSHERADGPLAWMSIA